MNFTESLWSRIADTSYAAILEHPFVKGLASGELSEDAFRHYVIQDALYLKDFARGLAVLGSRADEDDALIMFCEHARTAIIVERALHKGFLDAWNLSWEDVEGTEKAPNCLLYTSYLLQVVYSRPYYEALGAFLSCYWIYWEVGKALGEKGSPQPLYQRWIDTYAGEEFAQTVRDMLDVVERTCAPLNADQKEAVGRHFERTAKLEYMFWDMGYTAQQWPI